MNKNCLKRKVYFPIWPHIWVSITVYQYESPFGYVSEQVHNAICDQTSTLSSQLLVNRESTLSLL